MATVFNLEVQDLPEHYTPLESVAIIKCLDEDGDMALCLRRTTGLNTWETVGMLTAACDTARDDLRRAFRTEPTDGEGEAQ